MTLSTIRDDWTLAPDVLSSRLFIPRTYILRQV